MQASERKLHLRLNPDRTGNSAAGSTVGGITQQSCLSYPRLAAQNQRRAPPNPRIGQQPVQPGTLGFTSGEPGIGVLRRERSHLVGPGRD